MDHLIHQLENSFLRKGAYEIVGALTRGHGPVVVVLVGVAVIAAVFAFQKWYGKRG
jgi:hypothetical protein